MTSLVDNNHRFFSKSSIFNAADSRTNDGEDCYPFGLSLQERFPENKANDGKVQGGTMAPSPTQTATSSDTSLDIDFEF